MIALCALVAFAQDGSPVGKLDTASSLVSKMLSHYSGAQSMVGTIKLIQSAQNVSVTIDTALQFDMPDKIYLHQSRQSSAPRQWTVISNGSYFAYDRPAGVYGPDRFTEAVTQHGMHQNVRDIYAAADRSLGDRSPILDVAMGRTEDMRKVMGQWATMKIVGKVRVGDLETTEISGTYRDNIETPVSGNYEAFIGANFDFVRFILVQRFAVPGHADQVVDVTSKWDSDLKVNGPTNRSLYGPVR